MYISMEVIFGVVDLVFWKDLIIFQYWVDEKLFVVGFVVLMYEVCCWVEVEIVYIKVCIDEEV